MPIKLKSLLPKFIKKESNNRQFIRKEILTVKQFVSGHSGDYLLFEKGDNDKLLQFVIDEFNEYNWIDSAVIRKKEIGNNKFIYQLDVMRNNEIKKPWSVAKFKSSEFEEESNLKELGTMLQKFSKEKFVFT